MTRSSFQMAKEHIFCCLSLWSRLCLSSLLRRLQEHTCPHERLTLLASDMSPPLLHGNDLVKIHILKRLIM